MNTRFSSRFAAPLALALSLASIAPAVAADNGSDQPVSDTWITTKVKSELATTDGVKSMEVLDAIRASADSEWPAARR